MAEERMCRESRRQRRRPPVAERAERGARRPVTALTLPLEKHAAQFIASAAWYAGTDCDAHRHRDVDWRSPLVHHEPIDEFIGHSPEIFLGEDTRKQVGR